MTSYSQYGEDEAILDFLSHLKCEECEGNDLRHRPGCTCSSSNRFLDIGAWAPRTFSNTRALYEAGWSGVMFEPSPGPMLGLLGEYGNDPRITLIQAAVSPTMKEGLVRMKVCDDGVSTSEAAQQEIWKESTWRGFLMVPSIALERISLQFGHFAMWNIDAEGQSAQIFLRMLELELRPRCVCVEHDGRIGELLQASTAVGYKCSLSNGTNLVMVR